MTKVRLRWVPNRDRVLARDSHVERVLHRQAEKGADIARTLAPVDTGRYRDSIVADGPNLEATDFKAHWIEWGTLRRRAHATLRTAARRVADRVVDL